MIDIEKFDDETQAIFKKEILVVNQIDADVEALFDECEAFLACAKKDNLRKDPSFYVFVRRFLEILPNIKSIRRFISVVNMKKKVNCHDSPN